MHRGLGIASLGHFNGFVPMVMAQDKSGFQCTFGPGSQASWDTGKLKIEKTNFGNPSAALHFDSVDIEKQGPLG